MVTKKLSILLVEDDAAHVELIQRALESKYFEYELRVCDNLIDSTLAIQSKTPDLLITDLNLPDGKGTELIGPSQSSNFPVILMTSYGDENIAADAIKSGAMDYMVKSPKAFLDFPKTISRVMREWQLISDKTQAQEALLKKEHEQEEILNSLVDAVITIDHEGIVLSVNNAALMLFGYSAEEFIGLNARMLLNQSDLLQYNVLFKDYLQSRDPNLNEFCNGIEVNVNHKHGNKFLILTTIIEIESVKGKRRFVCSGHDLTVIKLREEQLRQSQRMDALGQLTGSIAHDYNNILGIILGYSEQIINQVNNVDKVESYCGFIQKSVERGSRLAKKLLTVSQYKKPEVTVVYINKLLNEQQELLRKIVTVRITLTFFLEDELWPVELDSNDLEDAVVNMCINSKQAMPVNGELIISARNVDLDMNDAQALNLTAGNYVLLSITDNGSGMSDIIKEKIFDPFYSTKEGLGNGLGLSQVYGFVERSGGAINVFSEMNQGSCFSLYFPRSGAMLLEEPNKTISAITECSVKETILVVDDEPDLVNLLFDVLSAEGYQVLTANDGEQALVLLEKESADLIISDVIMPNMDGFQLAAQVQKLYPDIKIQMVSGYSDDRHKAIGDKSLHDNILHKPYRFKILLERVTHLLNN